MYKSDLLEINAAINEKSQKLSKEILGHIMKVRRQVIARLDDTLDLQEGVFSQIEEEDWYKSLSKSKQESVASLVFAKLKKDSALLIEKTRKSQLDEALQVKQIQKIPHITEHKAREKIESKKRRRFYTYQSVFSDYNDFLELEDDGISGQKEDKLLYKIVIDPSKISDSLLVELSQDEAKINKLLEQEKRETRKVKKEEVRFILNTLKVKHIDELKDLLSNTNPILYGVKSRSGRINVVEKKGHKTYGKILLVSSPSFFDETKVKNPEYKQTLSLFDSIYDFLRSQYYTLQNISSEKDRVKDFGKKTERLLTLPGLEDTYLDVFVDDMYFSVFGDETNYHVARATDRIKKLQATKGENKQIDFARMSGVSRDFGNRGRRLSGQEASISLQLGQLQNIFRIHLDRIKSIHSYFYDNFIPSLDMESLEEIIISKDDTKVLDFYKENKHILEAFKNHMQQNTSFERQFSAYPFNVFWDEIDVFESELRGILNTKHLRSEDSVEIFRKMYSLNLKFKRQKAILLLTGIKHLLKLDKCRKRGLYGDEYSERQEKITIVLQALSDFKVCIETKDFLGNIGIGNKAQQFIDDTIKKIDVIHEMLMQGELDLLEKYLTN